MRDITAYFEKNIFKCKETKKESLAMVAQKVTIVL